jgi:hypothetical protein
MNLFGKILGAIGIRVNAPAPKRDSIPHVAPTVSPLAAYLRTGYTPKPGGAFGKSAWQRSGQW